MIVPNLAKYSTDQYCCGFIGGTQQTCNLDTVSDNNGFEFDTDTRICNIGGELCDTYHPTPNTTITLASCISRVNAINGTNWTVNDICHVNATNTVPHTNVEWDIAQSSVLTFFWMGLALWGWLFLMDSLELCGFQVEGVCKKCSFYACCCCFIGKFLCCFKEESLSTAAFWCIQFFIVLYDLVWNNVSNVDDYVYSETYTVSYNDYYERNYDVNGELHQAIVLECMDINPEDTKITPMIINFSELVNKIKGPSSVGDIVTYIAFTLTFTLILLTICESRCEHRVNKLKFGNKDDTDDDENNNYVTMTDKDGNKTVELNVQYQ